MSTQFDRIQNVPKQDHLATRAVIWRDVYNDQYLIAPPVYTARDLAEGCPGICYTSYIRDAIATARVITWDPSRVQPYTPPPASKYFKKGTDDEQKTEILSRLDRARAVLEEAVYDADTQDCLKAQHLRKLESIMGKIEILAMHLDNDINN